MSFKIIGNLELKSYTGLGETLGTITQLNETANATTELGSQH